MAIIEVIAEKKACLENKTPQRSNSTPAASTLLLHLHHLTQKGLIGCPGTNHLLFSHRCTRCVFNTLIRCDKFNELVSEEEKPVRLWFSESDSQGNLWTADSCQPHSSSSSQLNSTALQSDGNLGNTLNASSGNCKCLRCDVSRLVTLTW